MFIRKTISAAAAAFCFFVLAAASAHAQHKPFSYLLDAAKEINHIKYSRSVTTQDDNAKIAKVACDALTQLTNDNDLVIAVSGLLFHPEVKEIPYRQAAAALIDNIGEFNATFLPAEHDLMHRQGLEYPAIIDALQVASRIRSRASIKDATAAAILANINKAQSQVCEFAAGAVSDRQRIQTTWTMGGILLLGVDLTAALAITAGTVGTGMPAAGTLVLTSVALGSTAALAGATGSIP